MLENSIEQYFVDSCKKQGWLAWKFASPSNRSVPDRMVLLPGGWVCFVEVKATGKGPSPAQASKHRQMAKLNHLVAIIDSKPLVDKFIDETLRHRLQVLAHTKSLAAPMTCKYQYSDLYPKQRDGIAYLVERAHGGLCAGVGSGKSVMSMTAFETLRLAGMANKALVVAPKAVARFTWPTEHLNWEHLKHLRVSMVVGTVKQRERALAAEADLYVCNFDVLAKVLEASLIKDGSSWRLPWDLLLIDELNNIKDRKTQRYKALVRHLQYFTYRWGLTGTPSPNHLMELWPQMFVLDRGLGEREQPPYGLGSSYTRFQQRHFIQTDHFGRVWEPKRGTLEYIRDRLRPMVFAVSTTEMFGALPVHYNVIEVPLDAATSRVYRTMVRDLYVDLGTDVDAVNAAVAVGKLLQITSGAVYDNNRDVIKICTAKYDALQDVIAGMQGEPLLVVYQYKHELQEFLSRFPGAEQITSTSPQSLIDRWNAGDIEVALAHSASISEGINLQYGGHTMLLTTQIHSGGRRTQMIGRLLRKGQTETVIVHDVLARLDDGAKTVDHAVHAAIARKGRTQAALLDAFGEIEIDSPVQSALRAVFEDMA